MAGTVKPMAKGLYVLRCKDRTFIAAAANGHAAIWPESQAKSDGVEVRFTRDGQLVFVCNASYAAHNFEVVSFVAAQGD